MPQNALVGWHFAWPRWLTGRNAGKQAVNKDYVDQAIAGIGGGLPPGAVQSLFVNARGDSMSGALVLHADPINPQEAATKNYVDNHSIDVGAF